MDSSSKPLFTRSSSVKGVLTSEIPEFLQPWKLATEKVSEVFLGPRDPLERYLDAVREMAQCRSGWHPRIRNPYTYIILQLIILILPFAVLV